MRVFVIEFSMFNAVLWEEISYKITAETHEQLEKAVMDKLRWMPFGGDITPEEKWKLIQKNITETDLVFPIVDERIFGE